LGRFIAELPNNGSERMGYNPAQRDLGSCLRDVLLDELSDRCR